ncbi:BTB/POZ domain-containing protein At3g09030 [Amborella trichopoda]|uniref:Uncharacterized protein n=1 Tax=Amborella trichopoda TaxID=13333 RepID=W1PPL3_AMBTC|nr:BTB/POZ domain-containing protein At3g09030 [Amborella trichopoda]ERN09719.1 hypothetical protein AMTR_s00029p00225570 [Amborella trichopoda]|eukprot:XP_006848138.1 BTB/POZ domain-containing protein At3g09030 [Amborella trichopoda]
MSNSLDNRLNPFETLISEQPANNNRPLKLNVGGQLFETTPSTLQRGGPDSLLFSLSTILTSPIFIDRDPQIFSLLLSLLRTGRLPSLSLQFSKEELLEEAQYYGIEALLKKAMAPPPLQGFDMSRVAVIWPENSGFQTKKGSFRAVFATSGDGSLWVAHDGQITGYDSMLSHSGTFRTHIDRISSLSRISPLTCGIGSEETPGLHFYQLLGGQFLGSVNWVDPSDPRIFKASVTAIDSSETNVFASFECRHRENCILSVDQSSLKVVSEIGRQGGSSAKAMAAMKLRFLKEFGALMVVSVTSGAFGHSGYVRLWDLRSGGVVWEWIEPGSGRSGRFGDTMADVDADEVLGAMFKVCSKSGDIAMADLRNLGSGDPWIYLEESNPSLKNSGGGHGSLIHCYNEQVFCSKESGLEAWCKIPGTEHLERETVPERLLERETLPEKAFRRNFVERESRGVITGIECGGERLFLSREGSEEIQVWETRRSSGSFLA